MAKHPYFTPKEAKSLLNKKVVWDTKSPVGSIVGTVAEQLPYVCNECRPKHRDAIILVKFKDKLIKELLNVQNELLGKKVQEKVGRETAKAGRKAAREFGYLEMMPFNKKAFLRNVKVIGDHGGDHNKIKPDETA